ncbi:MAG: HAMP domain-containing sensor histidine kinase [Bdellovibrionota bacterium]
MKVVTREELGLRIREEASLIVLYTAMFFVLAGSLWAHFALNSSFFTPNFFALWLLLHAQPFLMLTRRNLWAPLSGLGFVTLQVYFYFAFYKLEMPYIPLAPLFFVITAQCLPLLKSPYKSLTWAYWLIAWGSVLFWMKQGAEAQTANVVLPVGIAAAIGFCFQLGFMVMMGVFGKRLSNHVGELGRKENFDERRIQASKLQSVGELTASLIHEINNPLTNIAGYSHQIGAAMSENDPDVLALTRESNERIKFNVGRIKDITAAVRRLVRPSSHQQEESVSMKELMDDSLTLMKHHLKSFGIELKVDCDADDCRARGNFTEISQVVVNLLSNARDAVREAEMKVISLGYKSEGGNVTVWVQDSGRGIPDDYAEEVFKPFFTTKAHQEGTGLGLYISKLIAERNKAELAFETLKDRSGRVLGTRFTLTLREKAFQKIAA